MRQIDPSFYNVQLIQHKAMCHKLLYLIDTDTWLFLELPLNLCDVVLFSVEETVIATNNLFCQESFQHLWWYDVPWRNLLFEMMT